MNKATVDSASYARINHACLITLTVIAVTSALIYTSSILVPFVIAVFLYAVAAPIIHLLQVRLKVPRFLAITLVVGASTLFSIFLVIFIVNSVEEFVRGADTYRATIVNVLGNVSDTATRYGYELNDEKLQKRLQELPIFGMVRNLTGNVASVITNAGLVILLFLFLVIGEGKRRNRNSFYLEIQNMVSRYIATKTMLSLLTGFLVWIVLVIAGVDLAFMFAVLTVALNFIPNIGSIIAILLPLPLILLQFGFGVTFLTVLGFTAAIQMSIGNIIEPKLMGDNMDLHPITVMLFLMFWGLVWGIPGMFLAVPITAVLRIVLSRIPSTHTLAEILAGRLPQN